MFQVEIDGREWKEPETRTQQGQVRPIRQQGHDARYPVSSDFAIQVFTRVSVPINV